MSEEIKVEPHGMVLIELSRLCCHSELPKTYTELSHLLWKAFDLGKEYRDKGGKE